MVFSSILFLFRFLPIAFLLYYLVPKKLKNFTLLVLSLVAMPTSAVQLGEDSLFLFCGRRTDRIKALYCDSHGLRP